MRWDQCFSLSLAWQVDLMVSGNEPVKAIAYIYELQLFWVVFSLPHEHGLTLPQECDRLVLWIVSYDHLARHD